MKGVVLDLKSIDTGDLDLSPLKNVLPDCRYCEVTGEDDVISRACDTDIIITNKVRLTEAHFSRLPALKLVCVTATGTNNVDLDAAAQCGVRVVNVTGYAVASVIQHVFGLILALTLKLNQYQAALRDGRWQHSDVFCLLDYPIHELQGKCLGIIGYGVLGQAVARVAEAFGMRLLVAEHKGKAARSGRMPLDQVIAQGDVITLHCPLTPQTQQLIGRAEFAKMKPNALLINAARGGIVDETALLDALQQRRIAGAGIDVLCEEPPVKGNPLLEANLPNLIVTPHIAWASIESRQRVIDETARNVAAFMSGQSRNVVV